MDVGMALRLRTVAVLLLINALLASFIPPSGKPSMLPIYMTAAERIVRGEEIYRPDDHQPFTYPPFFVLPVLPLVRLSPLAQARLWWFINLCLLEAVILITARMVWPTVERKGDGPGTAPRWVLPLLVAALSGRFLVSPLEYQSHDLIVFALVMLAGYAMAQQREAMAGIWAGLAAACKATPLLFLPLFCWQRRYRAALCLLATLLVATLLPDMLLPPRSDPLRGCPARPWVVHWYEQFISKVHADAPAQADGAWTSWNLLNQSLSATIYRLTTPVESRADVINVCVFPLRDPVRQRLTLGLELLVVGWLAWCTRPRRETAVGLEPGLAALAEVGMLVCAMLLLSPMSSSQHFGMLLAPIAACATYWMYVRRDRFVAGVLLLVFLFGTLVPRDLLALVARDLMGRYARWPQAVGCKTWIAVALLLACGHILRTARGPQAGADLQPPQRS